LYQFASPHKNGVFILSIKMIHDFRAVVKWCWEKTPHIYTD
jgi:hypothetical protein